MGDLLFVVLVVGGLGAFFFAKWHGEQESASQPICAAEEVVAEEVDAEEVVAEEVELDALS